MSKTARLYQDTRAASAGSNLDRLNDDLQDVTRIMTKNMEELLWRGDSLDSMCFRCGLETPCVYHVLLVSRNVAFVNLPSDRVRKVPQGSAQHQFQCHAAAVCPIRRYSFYSNHSHLVEIYMTFPSGLFVYISPRVRLFAERRSFSFAI